MIEQKLNAYVVSLNFASGKNVVQTVFAPNVEGAAAIVTHDIMLKPEIRDETALTSCLVGAIAEEWLRTAHRVIVEGGKPEGEVVRLVSDNLRPVAPEEAAAVEALRARAQMNYVPPPPMFQSPVYEAAKQTLQNGHEWRGDAAGINIRCAKCHQRQGGYSDICPGPPPTSAA